mmetsp:Transcript_58829/g.108662  ORF Transcript_58829/g.108662 Transcript_58829/m.108662 type:complete len:216 (-) Transcript_58829:144-791(-)
MQRNWILASILGWSIAIVRGDCSAEKDALLAVPAENVTNADMDCYLACIETNCLEFDWTILEHFNSEAASIVGLLSCDFVAGLFSIESCDTLMSQQSATIMSTPVNLGDYMTGALVNLTYGQGCRATGTSQCPVQPCSCTGCMEHAAAGSTGAGSECTSGDFSTTSSSSSTTEALTDSNDTTTIGGDGGDLSSGQSLRCLSILLTLSALGLMWAH